MCLSLANYCRSKYGFKTACLELHTSAAFSQLAAQDSLPIKKEASPALNHFTIYDVDYYPLVSHQKIPELMNTGYQYLILDFGVITEAAFSEFIRCSRKLVVGSLSPWKQVSTYGFFHTYDLKNISGSFLFLLSYSNNADIVKLSKKTGTPKKYIQKIPFLEEPFHITKEQFSFLEKLLN